MEMTNRLVWLCVNLHLQFPRWIELTKVETIKRSMFKIVHEPHVHIVTPQFKIIFFVLYAHT